MQWLMDIRLIVTDDKEGDSSIFQKEIHDASLLLGVSEAQPDLVDRDPDHYAFPSRISYC